jgi:cardiolipin synthase
VLLAAWGCAQLPHSDRIVDARHGKPVAIEGARGPLSSARSAEILAELKRKSGAIDILQKHVALEEAIVGSPLVAGNRVVLLQDGGATYEAMFAAIRAARDHINLETYIIEDDEVGRQFSDVLLQKQAAGVQVNLIYDSVGSIKTPKAFFERLGAGGIRVLEFNPVNPLTAKRGWRVNNRDHRKLLIVDGHTAFLGGINISSVYSSGSVSGSASGSGGGSGGRGADSNSWRDTHIQVQGPVVDEFQKLFLQTWEKQKGPTLAGNQYFPKLAPKGGELVRAIGSSFDDAESLIYLTLLSAITNAEDHVHLAMAYFAPDPQLLEALTGAAKRGVKVKLILPSHTDSQLVFHAGRSHYATLLAAGVQIFERRGRVLHSKTAVIDGVWSCVGSTNLDSRSFLHNDEINAAVLGREFAAQMQAAFDRDLAQSDVIDAAGWDRRPLRYKVRERAARLFEYWL